MRGAWSPFYFVLAQLLYSVVAIALQVKVCYSFLLCFCAVIAATFTAIFEQRKGLRKAAISSSSGRRSTSETSKALGKITPFVEETERDQRSVFGSLCQANFITRRRMDACSRLVVVASIVFAIRVGGGLRAVLWATHKSEGSANAVVGPDPISAVGSAVAVVVAVVVQSYWAFSVSKLPGAFRFSFSIPVLVCPILPPLVSILPVTAFWG